MGAGRVSAGQESLIWLLQDELVVMKRDREQLKTMLADVVAHLEAEMPPLKDGNAPGHAHQTPGVWDRSGTPCGWCALWKRVKARLDEA